MKVTNVSVTRTTNSVMVETDAISYRSNPGHQGVALGPVIKVTRLSTLTAKAYGFNQGEAYSIKEYGRDTRYVVGYALVICEGTTYTMRQFYNQISQQG